MPLKQAQIHVIISGRVQGVFFRHYTQKYAIQNNLTGWVKNRSDGSVEAVFEGNECDIALMLDWCRNGPPSASVSEVAITHEEPTDAFPDFRIVYE